MRPEAILLEYLRDNGTLSAFCSERDPGLALPRGAWEREDCCLRLCYSRTLGLTGFFLRFVVNAIRVWRYHAEHGSERDTFKVSKRGREGSMRLEVREQKAQVPMLSVGTLTFQID